MLESRPETATETRKLAAIMFTDLWIPSRKAFSL